MKSARDFGQNRKKLPGLSQALSSSTSLALRRRLASSRVAALASRSCPASVSPRARAVAPSSSRQVCCSSGLCGRLRVCMQKNAPRGRGVGRSPARRRARGVRARMCDASERCGRPHAGAQGRDVRGRRGRPGTGAHGRGAPRRCGCAGVTHTGGAGSQARAHRRARVARLPKRQVRPDPRTGGAGGARWCGGVCVTHAGGTGA